MEEVTNTEQVQPKKKKKHRGLKITLIVIAALIIIPIGAVYACFFDNGKSKVVKDENFVAEDLFSNAFAASLDNIAENHSLELVVDTNDFNQLLVNALDGATSNNETMKEIFTGIELETNDDTYVFTVDINLKNIFLTRAYLTTSFAREDISGYGDCFIFNINDIKLGRISGIQNLITTFAPDLLTDDMLQEAFDKTGLSFKSDLANMRIFYPTECLTEDIINNIGAIGDSLFDAMLEQFLDLASETTIEFNKDGLLGQFDLSDYSSNPNFVTPDKNNTVEWSVIKEICSSMIKDGIIGENYTGKNSNLHSDLYNYLVNGYDEVSENLKSIFNKLEDNALNKYSKGTIQIPSVTNYQGVWSDVPQNGKITRRSSDYLKNEFSDKITYSKIINENLIGDISENVISEMLGSSDIIGTSYLVSGYTSNKGFFFAPLVITNMYANIVNNEVRYVINLNLNGYDTYLCVNSELSSFDPISYTANFTIGEMTIGQTKLTDSFITSTFDLIEEAFEDIELVSFNKNSKALSLSFAPIIDSLEIDELITTLGTATFTMSGSSLQDEGKMILGVKTY